MGKLLTFLSALLLLAGEALASAPADYEWWFDNDVSDARRGKLSSAGSADFIADASGLPQGTHYFNCRVSTGEGVTGSVFRRMFYSLGKASGEISCFYWFDEDYAHGVKTDITAGSKTFDIDVSSLTPGVHYFNCRLSKGDETVGSVYRKMLFITPSGNSAVGFEYWLNDDYAAKTEGTVAKGANSYDVDLKGLRKGVHRFNYRLRTNDGSWGSVYSKYFFYSTGANPFTKYEYWLDDDFGHRVSATATGNPVSFDIDLSNFDKSGTAHFLTVRVRDDDGEWSSFYRKMIVFRKPGERSPVIGYRHTVNGSYLGEVRMEREIADSYAVDVDVPDNVFTELRDIQPVFDGNRVSVLAEDTVRYAMQVQTELGWAVPQEWEIPVSRSFAAEAVEMAVNTSRLFGTPKSGEFAAVRFASPGDTLYFRADAEVEMDLYQNGKRIREITGKQLNGMARLVLAKGEYFGILRDAAAGAGNEFTLHLMDTPNMAPTPELSFANGKVTITCSRDDAEIHYAIEDYLSTGPAVPGAGSPLYEDSFDLDHNAVVKAIAIVPGSDIQPSAIGELIVDSYKVNDPAVRFANLTVIVTPDTRPGVRTYYTLDGKEPSLVDNGTRPAEGTQEYTAPVYLTGNAKVMVRSFKPGYNPSAVVEYNHNYASYVTGAPRFSVDGATVTLTATTSGSRLYYAVGTSDPSAMTEYKNPFKVDGNLTVYAQARKDAMYDSEVVSCQMTGLRTPAPSHTYDKATGTLTLTCADRNATVWYAIGQKTNFSKYSGTLHIDGNCTVYAKATAANYLDSEIVEITVDNYKVADPSISLENLYVVIRSETLDGVRTYYTLDGKAPSLSADGKTPAAGTHAYTSPFRLSANATVRAQSFKDGYKPSAVVDYIYNHAAHVTGAPDISVDGATVTLTATTAGSRLYYSVGSAEPSAMTLYSAPFRVDGNLTVYAQARKDAMYDSEVVSRQVTGLHADTPSYSYDKASGKLTLACSTRGAVIWYAINQNTDFVRYADPVHIGGNCTVYAKATAQNYLDSDVVEITVSEFKCQDVRISYNGRYVTLATDEPDAEIRYTLDGSNPAGGKVYGGTFDAEGLGTVRAVVRKSAFMDSEIAEYRIPGYADEEHAETAAEGVLESCYVWAGAQMADTVSVMRIAGRLGETDYRWLRSLKSLRHLDISEVGETRMPDRALAGTGLVTVSMPEDIAGAGAGILGDNPDLCAVIWNSTELRATKEMLGGIGNGNLLLYLPEASAAEDDLGAIRNRIVGLHAADIELADRMPFHAPLQFSADRIGYTRNFSKLTEIGICSGWETLTVPFDVEVIEDAAGEVMPFDAAGDDDRPFWLYRPDRTGWESTGRISAYMPYLISMPNNPEYIESFNIRGDVRFSASSAIVEATPDPAGYACRPGIEMWPCYGNLAADAAFAVLNDGQEGADLPGSVFMGGARDVRPFECYLTAETPISRMPVFDRTGVDTILGQYGVKVWTEGSDVCILSGISRRIRVYDTVGQLLRIVEATAGEETRVQGLTPGIYLVANTKVLVK